MELFIGFIVFGLLILLGWLVMQWSEYKKLQRAVSIANKASGFIKDLEGQETGYETIQMKEVINELDLASRKGRDHLDKKGSTEL